MADPAVQWSDFAGLVAAVCLVIPAIKDQVYRYMENRQDRKADESSWAAFRKTIASAWRYKRDSYDAWDSLLMLLGAAGLVLTFLLKLAGA